MLGLRLMSRVHFFPGRGITSCFHHVRMITSPSIFSNGSHRDAWRAQLRHGLESHTALLQLPLLHAAHGITTKRCFSTPADRVSEQDKGHLVYKGRVGSLFKTLKLFSLTTSSIGLALQPYLAMTYQDAPLVTAVPFFAALNIFVFVNPLLIHYIGKKYVLEMYFNRDTKVFTAVLLSFFARRYTMTFTASDVKVPDVPGLFAILTVKDRPLFVLDADFTDIEVYKHMMGFDKPLDLTFLQEEIEKK